MGVSFLFLFFTFRGSDTPRAHQGVLLGREAGVRAILTTRARSSCVSQFSANPKGSFFEGGTLPEPNVVRGWHREHEPGRGNYCILLSVRDDPCLYTPVTLHRIN